MVAGVIVIAICFIVLYNERARAITQEFLDSTLGRLFNKKGEKV